MTEPFRGDQSRQDFEAQLVQAALESDIMTESARVYEQILKELGLNHPAMMTAIAATRLSGRQVLALHGASPDVLQIIYKADAGATPRTEADLRSGVIGMGIVRKFHPVDMINEEETGVTEGSSRAEWHIDALDGTSSFTEEQQYSTVGMEYDEDGQPVVAAILNPFERQLLIAQAGAGSYLLPLNNKLRIVGDPRKLEVKKKDLKGGVVFMDALFNKKTAGPKLAFMNMISQSTGNVGFRMTGSNIDQQRHVAKGSALASVTDAVGGFYDFSGRLIIEEAGGKFTDMYGDPVSKSTQFAIGSNGLVHDQLLDFAQEAYGPDYKGFR